MAKVFGVSAIPLTISEVVDYLKDPPAEQVNSIPPVEPKAGEMYLFQGSGVKKGKCTLEGLHARAYGYWQQMKTTEDLEGLEGQEFS